MDTLICKEKLNKEELEKIDCYYEKNIKEALKLDNKVLLRLMKSINETLGYSLLEVELNYFFYDYILYAKYFFNEELIDEYIKCCELIKEINMEHYSLFLVLGDYFMNKDKEKAISFYSEVFKEGFNLCDENYFDCLVNYLTLLNINSAEILINLVETSPKVEEDYSLDLIDTYLLMIVKLDKNDERYIKYIDEAIQIAYIVVNRYRKKRGKHTSWSDTDEERNLCELLCLKFIHYIKLHEFVKAYEIYNELTNEIHLSDCTRYYHSRDKYYYEMLDLMSNEYPELSFFKDISYERFEIIESINDINDYLNKEITLKDEEGIMIKFVIKYIGKDSDISLVPILPLLGEGGYMFMHFIKENGKYYLVNGRY